MTRRVDGDLILKDKGNVEAIVINDISVPLVKSEVGNIQKLEKKKKRSAQQDVNNAEDDCRNRFMFKCAFYNDILILDLQVDCIPKLCLV